METHWIARAHGLSVSGISVPYVELRLHRGCKRHMLFPLGYYTHSWKWPSLAVHAVSCASTKATQEKRLRRCKKRATERKGHTWYTDLVGGRKTMLAKASKQRIYGRMTQEILRPTGESVDTSHPTTCVPGPMSLTTHRRDIASAATSARPLGGKGRMSPHNPTATTSELSATCMGLGGFSWPV